MVASSAPRPPVAPASWPRGLVVALAVAALLLAGIIGGVVGSLITDRTSGSIGSPASCQVAGVASKVLPAVVTIAVSGQGGSGTGSGVIIDPNGTVVTNNHVIAAGADGGQIEATLDDGSRMAARLIGRDPTTDIAVLRLEGGRNLPTVAWGDSDSLIVGQPVVAAGAPLGLSGTITSGVISALGRDVPVPVDENSSTVLAGAVQTDASINPGNSGGALVTCSGQLIGINTAIATVPDANGTGGGGSVGIGFAVPETVAKSITEQLIKNGRASHPTFGMGTSPVTRTSASGQAELGLLVTTVDSGGPAEKAGIRTDDVITTIQGVQQLQPDSLAYLAVTASVGDHINVTIERDGQQRQVAVQLAAS